MTDKLKPCPFCGGNAILRHRPDCRLDNISMLTDSWHVECINNCVSTQSFRDRIFRQIDGEFFIGEDGRKMAIDAWNKRAKNE